MPVVNFKIKNQLLKIKKQGIAGSIALKYLEEKNSNRMIVFTEESKDPERGRTGAAVYIPCNKVSIKKRCTDHLSVYSVALIVIIIALQWIEEHGIDKAVIASDSWAALTSIQTMKSCKQELIFEVHNVIYKI